MLFLIIFCYRLIITVPSVHFGVSGPGPPLQRSTGPTMTQGDQIVRRDAQTCLDVELSRSPLTRSSTTVPMYHITDGIHLEPTDLYP
jgi:hypothetical protein